MDARQGRGIMPTWFDPITPWLGIPIDHVFHSPEFYVVDHTVVLHRQRPSAFDNAYDVATP